MLDSKLLKNKINDSGLKSSFIAEKLNMSRQSVNKKINGISPFTTNEAQILTDILHLSIKEREEIFFTKKVD